MALTNAPARSNVNENWLFDFTADNDNCLEFTASDNDNINFGNILSTPFVNFTIEFWCNADVINSGVVIQLSASGEDEDENVSFSVSLQTGGEFQLFYEYGTGSNESNTTSDFDLSADTWTHVAVVRDDSTGEAYFYKNGALVETESASNDPTGGTSADADLTIGNNFNNNNGYDGELAQVRVWNTARTAVDISHYSNRLVDSSHSGLVGYWKLDEGSGTSVADSSSASNSGTITGAEWSVGQFDQFIHSFGLAFHDTTVSSNRHVGSVLNKNITLRDSIDITSGTSATGNLSITSANFKIQGTELYKLLYNGTNNYFNKEVRIYAQYDNVTTLTSCQQLFSGRLVEVKLNQDQNITMQINSHRPWDKIEFPQTQHTPSKLYEPVVYGAFNYSDHIDASYGGLFPVPLIITEDLKIKTLMPRSYTSGNNNYLHFYVGQDYFLSMASTSTTGGVELEATVVDNGVNVLKTPVNYYAKGYIVPNHGNDLFGRTELTDPANPFTKTSTGDWDTDTFAYYTHPDSSTGVNRYLQMMTVPAIAENTKIRKFKLRHGVVHTDGSGFGQYYQMDMYQNGSTIPDNIVYDNSTDNAAGTQSGTGATGSTTEFSLQTAATCPTELNLDFENNSVPSTYTSEAHTLKLFGVKIFVSIRFWSSESANNADDYTKLNQIKYFYCGGDGLTATWDDGAISHGHDAHRDLLMRFAGVKKDTPGNWSALNTDRAINTWKIRYWQLEPTPLKEALDKLAYEFGFVAKFSPAGLLKYIHVLKSSELSATLNLTKADIDKVTVSTTGLDNVVTQWNIANNKHPAPASNADNVTETSGRKAGYYTFTAIANANRAKYNLGDKEGIVQINLDQNVGTIPTTADADCNADFYSYYDNIIGDMKILVECDVVNPAKGYQLETGDIVTFTDMPVEMFGTAFSTSKYYMIIETKRSLGKVSITAREVG